MLKKIIPELIRDEGDSAVPPCFPGQTPGLLGIAITGKPVSGSLVSPLPPLQQEKTDEFSLVCAPLRLPRSQPFSRLSGGWLTTSAIVFMYFHFIIESSRKIIV